MAGKRLNSIHTEKLTLWDEDDLLNWGERVLQSRGSCEEDGQVLWKVSQAICEQCAEQVGMGRRLGYSQKVGSLSRDLPRV